MARGVVDTDGMTSDWATALRQLQPSEGLGFDVTGIGHVVLKVTDLERSAKFYTEVLGFKVSDVYPATMMAGGMVFLRFNSDHHGLALIGGASSATSSVEMHHMAFEVGTLDEVIRARDHLVKNAVPISFEGRRRAGCQIAVEFEDPDGHCLDIYWGLDQVGSEGQVRAPEGWREAQSIADAVANPPAGQDTTIYSANLKP